MLEGVTYSNVGSVAFSALCRYALRFIPSRRPQEYSVPALTPSCSANTRADCPLLCQRATRSRQMRALSSIHTSGADLYAAQELQDSMLVAERVLTYEVGPPGKGGTRGIVRARW
ncbi:hypothetical protein SCE1572_39645 [Sorangium cellulosum So0157-2]|uniref:Uncharacterized protein n=1 Tax=Sorangium cellulosum So0157-2 TaxID=1254432 RepID=S4Y5J5_SORCE|nr:hypothetical protein [Sorangium cellulosum]AGP40084.1 hypothetical protein SCE1572_39645 [Sorangium cellulosum So0157-2]